MVNPPPDGFRAAVAEYAVAQFGALTVSQLDYVLSRVEPRYGHLGMTWAEILGYRPAQSIRSEVSIYVDNARKVGE